MAPELRNKTYIMQKLQGNNYKAERVYIYNGEANNERTPRERATKPHS